MTNKTQERNILVSFKMKRCDKIVKHDTILLKKRRLFDIGLKLPVLISQRKSSVYEYK